MLCTIFEFIVNAELN